MKTKKIVRPIPDSPLDLIILLFYHGEEQPITSIVRLDKMIQLLYELGRFQEAFEYLKEYGKTSKFSPFTEDLLIDLQTLEEMGLLQVNGSTYYPTPFLLRMGWIYEITKVQHFQINLVRRMLNDIELDPLLRMVYFEKLSRKKKNDCRQSLLTSKNESD